MSEEHPVDALSFTATAKHHGKRLDKWLADAAGKSLTRSRIKQLLLQGAIAQADDDGAILSDPSMKVTEGLSVEIHIPPTQAMDLTPTKMDLDIIFEDAAIIVINKPVGLTVHPAAGTANDTLVHGLLHHCGDSLSGIGGVARPGIVHRIDKDTSGLLVVAKTDQAHQHLANQLQTRTLKRTYYALAWGHVTPPAGKIDAPIARHKVHRKKMAVMETGRAAVTHYQTQKRFIAANNTPIATALEVNLETGRTHQIRVHFQHLGHALVGDQTYGATTGTRLARLQSQHVTMDDETQCFLRDFSRQALHARKLHLIHPVTGELMAFEAPLPDDLATLEKRLDSLT